ncbi:MAG TPA: hypothetical protein VGO24_04425 [Solirubrobacterales bacterium]|jgi:hypothetical protein|nr:hypothetical protein [Solirubrobacterales bacterium]
MSHRVRLGLLAAVTALLLVAAAPASAGASAVYKLQREGLRITLVVKGDHLAHLRIWVKERCSDGTSPARTVDERDLHPVSVRGGLLYVGGYSTEYGYEETRLSAHVTPAAVKGAFRDVEEEVGYYICATGHPGDRVLRFTARRVR